MGSFVNWSCENELSFLSKGVDKLMEDLLKCVSRAEPSRAEPSRAEPSYAIGLPFYMNMLAVLLCWKAALFWLRQKCASLGFFALWSVLLALPLCFRGAFEREGGDEAGAW